MKKLLIFLMMLTVMASGAEIFGQSEKTDDVKLDKSQAIGDERAPIMRIVSPIADARIAVGEGFVGAGSPNGSGFALNLEIVTREAQSLKVNESLNIRNTALLGSPNPNIPGLSVIFDTDLVTPDGGIIPRNTNLASLFNIAGTDDTPGEGVTVWLGWHVLESLRPGVISPRPVTITASITDSFGRVATDRVTLPATAIRLGFRAGVDTCSDGGFG